MGNDIGYNMDMKWILWICIMVLCSGALHAWTSETLDGWTLGINAPEISSDRVKADGTTGPTIHLLIGTSPFYYDVGEAGEGSVDFWIFDPGLCLEYTDTGYGKYGPQWGLVNTNLYAMSACMNRGAWVDGCMGYEIWSDASEYVAYSIAEGLRKTDEIPFAAGWYKWRADGKTEDIIFTIFDVDYDSLEGPGSILAHGDVSITIDAAFEDGVYAAAFGEGWDGFYLKGDAVTGIEHISVEVISGMGVFSEAGKPVAVTEEYEKRGWGMVKGLFK